MVMQIINYILIPCIKASAKFIIRLTDFPLFIIYSFFEYCGRSIFVRESIPQKNLETPQKRCDNIFNFFKLLKASLRPLNELISQPFRLSPCMLNGTNGYNLHAWLWKLV